MTDWLSFKDVFDGVFQRDDVLAAVGVDVLDHGRQRGGFAAPGRSRHLTRIPTRGFGDLASEPAAGQSSKLGTCV